MLLLTQLLQEGIYVPYFTQPMYDGIPYQSSLENKASNVHLKSSPQPGTL